MTDRSSPTEGRSYHDAADERLMAGDPRGAIAALGGGLGDRSDDFDGWMKLSALKRRIGDPDGALEAVDRALDSRPTDFLALLLKGSLHERGADGFRAAEVYRAAVFAVPQDAVLPPPIAAQLMHARAYLQRHRKAVESRLADAGALDTAHRADRKRFLDNILDRREDHHQQPTHYRYPGLADIEFFEDAYPAFLARLRDAFPAIQAEFRVLFERHADRQQPYVDFGSGQPIGQWAALNRSADWNALHLQRYGEIDSVNATACPHTIEALTDYARADIPGLAPNLMFSLLRGRTHIPPHHGVANFRSVLHLPLIVPPHCRFRVGGETREWREGEPFIFDDTIEHEAWNDSDVLRVVLIADMWRPELDLQDRAIIRDVLAAQEGGAPVGAL